MLSDPYVDAVLEEQRRRIRKMRAHERAVGLGNFEESQPANLLMEWADWVRLRLRSVTLSQPAVVRETQTIASL